MTGRVRSAATPKRVTEQKALPVMPHHQTFEVGTAIIVRTKVIGGALDGRLGTATLNKNNIASGPEPRLLPVVVSSASLIEAAIVWLSILMTHSGHVNLDGCVGDVNAVLTVDCWDCSIWRAGPGPRGRRGGCRAQSGS